MMGHLETKCRGFKRVRESRFTILFLNGKGMLSLYFNLEGTKVRGGNGLWGLGDTKIWVGSFSKKDWGLGFLNPIFP